MRSLHIAADLRVLSRLAGHGSLTMRSLHIAADHRVLSRLTGKVR
jgi:hypothetical protein